MSSWMPTTYKTKNWLDYNNALKRRGSLSIWFDAEMCWEAKASGQRGRQQAYSDAAIQACLTIKVLFGLPLRQTTGFVESLLDLVHCPTGDCAAICRKGAGLDCACRAMDAPMLPDLLDQVPTDQEIGRVTAPSHACKHALPGSECTV